MKNQMKLEMLELLYNTFPDTKTQQVVTKKQLITIEQMMPGYRGCWLVGETISRGVYTIKDLSDSSSKIKKTPIAIKVKEIMKPKEEPVTAMAFTFQSSENLIPKIDTDYVPFGIYKDVEKIVKSKIFFPTYIFGASGNGKSTSVEQVCANLGRPVIRINLNNMSDEDQLIGSKTLVDGNVEIVEGPILRAMRGGFTAILDECLEENEKVRVGTISDYKNIALKDLDFDTIYPIVSFNMETGYLENDSGSIISDKDDDVFEVELEDGRVIVLNAKHPFIVCNNGVFSEKTLEDGLDIGDEIVIF